MGFTRFEKDVKVHESLSDYPNADDGITAEQLKELFDQPASELKTALNKLMTELEATSAGTNIGIEKLTLNDTSGNTLIAKLRYIYNALITATMGQVPDNSITQAKINTTYEQTLAKKDGTLQTGLNSEKVGGNTLEQILSSVLDNIVTGTFTPSKTETTIVNLGFKPRCVIISAGDLYYTTYGGQQLTAIVTTEKPTFVYRESSDTSIALFELTNTGFRTLFTQYVPDGYTNYNNGTGYRYIAFK